MDTLSFKMDTLFLSYNGLAFFCFQSCFHSFDGLTRTPLDYDGR